jgi:hypothetical protein
VERTTPFTADFQDLITRYAWGEIWTRPGLDRKTRSCITLTALMARGQLEELALHVRAALRNGLTEDEIKEVFLQRRLRRRPARPRRTPREPGGGGGRKRMKEGRPASRAYAVSREW